VSDSRESLCRSLESQHRLAWGESGVEGFLETHVGRSVTTSNPIILATVGGVCAVPSMGVPNAHGVQGVNISVDLLKRAPTHT